MGRNLTIQETWEKFMLSAIVVGLVSVIWNLIGGYGTTIIWMNFLEKIFAFVIIGVSLMFLKKSEILKLDNIKRILIFSLLISLFITSLEIIVGTFPTNLFLSLTITKFMGAIIGILIVNLFYK